MNVKNCHNYHDFRKLAERRLPGPIFNYIDGGADDEETLRKNARSFSRVDLVPNVLRGASAVDTSVTVMGQKLAVPFYCSPTALQRLFHYSGERAVAAAASAHGTMFGVSSLGTCSLEDIRSEFPGPQVYQFYFHKDRGLNRAMIEKAKAVGVQVLMLTVDSITGGNRERDKRTGFSIPFRLTLGGAMQFALKPAWALQYATHGRFHLPQLEEHIDFSGSSLSIGKYFTEMLDPELNWSDAESLLQDWGGPFCLKGVMSTADARRARDIGCAGVILSNHGGRQLDGARPAFDQLDEVVQAVGSDLDVMMDGGVQRGTDVLKALAIGAKAVGLGRYYLFPLATAGQAGVMRALDLLQEEIVRGMRLLGCQKIADLDKGLLRPALGLDLPA